MTIGSLFDGSGGFPLAAAICGITPVWASEIEPYPIAVTRSRFPAMKHYGDVSKINGAQIEPVDIVSFGSPCQDLSVAGKRAGIRHEDSGDEETTRSGLFMDAVRIIKEMRGATNNESPKFAIFENVPGAFSSSGGADFLAVLQSLAEIVDPEVSIPASDKWSCAGEILGDGWSTAWRVLDSQYIRTAQRRRRIYLVLDLTGNRAGEILFERESLSWDQDPRRTPWQVPAPVVEGSVGSDDCKGVCYGISSYDSNAMKSPNPHSGFYEADTARTLDINGGNPACNQGGVAVVEPAVCIQGSMIGRADKNGPQGDGVNEDICFTLNATDRHGVAAQYLFENHSQDSHYKGPLDVSPMLPAQLGTGGNNTPFVVERDDIALDRASFNQGQNSQYDPQYYTDGTNLTIVAKGPSAVCYGINGDKAGTLDASYYKGCGMREGKERDVVAVAAGHRYIVRRLTPTECARLQGFPDLWGHPDPKTDFTDDEYAFWLDVRNTHAGINGKPAKTYTREQMLTWYNKLHTDSAEYRMWGNGVALPCVIYVMEGIADILREVFRNVG